MRNKIFKKKKILLRMFSLLSALLIWIYVVSSAEVELNKEVAIKIEIPKGLAIKNERPKSVVYSIKGPGLFVRKFFEEQEALTISEKTFKNRRGKKTLIDLVKYQNKLPLGLELVSIEPRQFYIELEKSISKTVQIKADFSPGILDKYKVQKLKFWPKTVDITGPRSVVKKLKFVSTKEIESLSVGFNDEVKVPLINPDSRVSLSLDAVSASMELINKTAQRNLQNTAIIFQSVGLIKYASQKKVELTVEGRDSDIANLDLDAVQVIALIPKGKRGEMTIELITELPQGIKVVNMTPKSINVIVE